MFGFCKRTIKSNLPVALRWAVVILVVGLVATFTQIGRATPVTLGFEAEVTSLSIFTPFDTDMDVAVGDTISGSFTFTPDPGDGGDFLDVTQSGATASFMVDGSTFVTTPAGNGIQFRVGNNGPIIDGPSGLFDSILFGGEFDQIPESPSIGITQAGWGINLTAPARFIIGVPIPDTGLPLPSAILPADIEVWNLLAMTHIAPSGSHIGISMRDGEGGSVKINARIKNFSRVPEPSTWVTAVSVFAFLLLKLR